MIEGETTFDDEERGNSDAEPQVVIKDWSYQVRWRRRFVGVVDVGTHASGS